MRYYLIVIGVMSVLAFVLYGVDKAKAKRHAWRISEAALLLVGFFGGAIGALVAMSVFRHKTKHWYFWAVNLAGLMLQVAVPICILMLQRV